MFKLYNIYCAVVFSRIRRRQILVAFPRTCLSRWAHIGVTNDSAMRLSGTKEIGKEICRVCTRYIPSIYQNDLKYMYQVYTRYIACVCHGVDNSIYQVYARYLPGLETRWSRYIPCIFLVYTFYIADVGIYLVYIYLVHLWRFQMISQLRPGRLTLRRFKVTRQWRSRAKGSPLIHGRFLIGTGSRVWIRWTQRQAGGASERRSGE